MGKNDEKVNELFAKLQELKANIKPISKVIFKTNLSFVMDNGSHYNLNVIQDEEIFIKIISFLLQKEWADNEARKRLGLPDIVFTHKGYTTEDWVHDIKAKLEQISHKNKVGTLNKFEKEIGRLLSPEQLREKEIELLTKNLDNLK